MVDPRISKALFKELNDLRKSAGSSYCLIATKEENGIFTYMVPLRRTGGCETHPASSRREITKHALELYAQGYAQLAYAYIPSSYDVRAYNEYMRRGVYTQKQLVLTIQGMTHVKEVAIIFPERVFTENLEYVPKS